MILVRTQFVISVGEHSEQQIPVVTVTHVWDPDRMDTKGRHTRFSDVLAEEDDIGGKLSPYFKGINPASIDIVEIQQTALDSPHGCRRS